MPELRVIASKEESRFYPFMGIFFLVRESFWTAGQDSWTQPPAQSPDLFQALTNVEPVLQGTLNRRRGYRLFANVTPSPPFSRSFSFRSEALGLRKLLFTSTAVVEAFNEDGSVYASNLFAPTAGAQAPRALNSRSYEFFADFQAVDLLKWNATLVSAPNAPTTSTVAGGALAATTYFVEVTYVVRTGETLPSTEVSQAAAINTLLVVNSPAAVSGATGWNVYVSTTTGTETKQNTATIAIGTNFTEPTTGLIAGSALPTSNTAQYITNWGIPPANLAGGAFGPSLGTTTVNPGNWTTPANLFATDSTSFTTISITNPGTTGAIQGTGFGFALGTGAIIQGIQVTGTLSLPAGTYTGSVNATLLKAGVVIGGTKSVSFTASGVSGGDGGGGGGAGGGRRSAFL